MGLIIIFTTFMMYKGMVQEDQVVKHSPLICMKVTGRERGAGTTKLPDIVYADYQGRSYRFECGRKYFRSTFGIDSIQVHYDATGNIAALPLLNFPHYTFLVIMISGLGILVIGDAIRTLQKYK